MAIKNFSKVLISNCLIDSNMQSGNISTTGGGAIALWTASPKISGCEFKTNTAVYGAAMAIYYSSNALIQCNHFHDNTGHGTINIGAGSAPIFMNNLIENNTSTAPIHGILHFEGGSGKAIFINNTIVNNNCGGGAIWENDSSTPLFVNNIIYGNKPAQVFLEAPSKLNFINCLIEGGIAGFTGSAFSGVYQDCIDTNPLLVSTNDFHLKDASPCINAGVDSIQVSNKWYYTPANDLEGKIRPNPEGSHPDVGAFENVSGNPISEIKNNFQQLPNEIQLYQNYPNPFNPETVIVYTLASLSRVRLTTYNLLGGEVATLVNEVKQPGVYQVIFDGRNCPSGLYFYKLEAGSNVMMQKMVLLK
jgi:hypothetical protein